MLHEWLLFIHIVGAIVFVAQAPAPRAPAPVSR